MTTRVYHSPKCSTCRKALKWLDERGVAYEAIDLVVKPPSAKVLKDLHQRSQKPLAKLFNTSGESYRGGNFKEKLKTMSDAEAFAALAADGKLIKRPLIDDGHHVLIGFDEVEYATIIKRK